MTKQLTMSDLQKAYTQLEERFGRSLTQVEKIIVSDTLLIAQNIIRNK